MSHVPGAGPHDPFAVDEERALGVLQRTWGGIYLCSVNDSKWYGTPVDGSGPAITAPTPGELNTALGVAWHRSIS